MEGPRLCGEVRPQLGCCSPPPPTGRTPPGGKGEGMGAAGLLGSMLLGAPAVGLSPARWGVAGMDVERGVRGGVSGVGWQG